MISRTTSYRYYRYYRPLFFVRDGKWLAGSV
jgi:hypothetical protein